MRDLPQYSSLNNPHPIVCPLDRVSSPGPEGIVTHLAFDAARDDAAATGAHGFGAELLQQGLVPARPVLRHVLTLPIGAGETH